jgi:hypothetical protein
MDIVSNPRRELKKRLVRLKMYLKHFWFNENRLSDLETVYGKDLAGEKSAEARYTEALREVSKLEKQLKEKSDANNS